MNPEDLENINEIDMECNFIDDDDDMLVIKKSKDTKINDDLNNELPDYNKNTGVIIDLNDDEDIKLPKNGFIPFNNQKDEIRTLTADIDDHNTLKINKNYESDLNDDINEDPNTIDMECSCGDYDDDDFGGYVEKPKLKFEDEEHINGNNLKSSKQKTILDFNEDPEYFTNELVSEEMIQEKKKISQGEVEKDYWAKLQKKHAASNKKGAYNTHFHLGGDPKKEAELFNHDMKTGKIPNVTNAAKAGYDDIGLKGEAEVSNSSITGAEVSMANAGSGEGCCESLKEDYTNKLNDIFIIIGFDIIKNSDGSYIAIDLCDDDKSIECTDKEDLIHQLTPYINDCFLYPLQVKTGENFINYNDWINWYNKESNKEKYPKCAEDINYLDIICNHLNECNF